MFISWISKSENFLFIKEIKSSFKRFKLDANSFFWSADKFPRFLNKDDIFERKLPQNTTGVVVTEISEGSPLMFVSVNDVIVELQKKKVKNSNQFSNLVKEIISKGSTTLYLAIFNSSNQRSYITVKLK